MFPFNNLESEDVQSSALFELPVIASSSGPLVGLKEGLGDSCLSCLEPGLVSGL